MRPLIIDDDTRYIIKKLMKYAERNELSLKDLQDTIDGTKEPIGNNPNHVCIIPHGYRVAYSIENQPTFKCKHISVSIDTKGMLPNQEAVKAIVMEFGFNTDLDDGKAFVYVEDQESINVLEPIRK
jgi:hypothetical protein